MLHLDAEWVRDNLDFSSDSRDGYAQLDAMIRAKDPAAVALEHFKAWYRADEQAWLALGEAPIALSLLQMLYQGEFEAHVAQHDCPLEWTNVIGFMEPLYYHARFRCVGRYPA